MIRKNRLVLARYRNKDHSHGGRWRRFEQCILMLAVLTAGGCPGAAPRSSPEEDVKDVAMQGIAFVPKEVTIRVGERVRWTNLDPEIHTTTSGDPADGNAGTIWDSGNLSPGASFVWQFDEAGEFEYFCIPHANEEAMRHAKVIVQP